MSFEIVEGDSLEVLKLLPDGCVDALVTDPPAGIGFMGKERYSAKGGRAEWVAWMTAIMRECLRVLKPGAHGLVRGLPRTSHRTATALEDAGFEVRDVITHHFGTGFPKSLDVSKAIDKAAGAERPIIGTNPRAQHTGKAGTSTLGDFAGTADALRRGVRLGRMGLLRDREVSGVRRDRAGADRALV